ncbi:hypothetical protein QBC32DRAFT_215092 [Pseudoneurospora amorphoporcata]|uniref:Ent-kaurene synthase n=1 Tax=Pseudoneurospora amorphoporcata TaxID=241081 RepID=A0AAN6NSV3_9PEZI|nr:hypothetical protein QBC32DRAFT_215092 [Pseudoneurospora amorphoporcata]
MSTSVHRFSQQSGPSTNLAFTTHHNITRYPFTIMDPSSLQAQINSLITFVSSHCSSGKGLGTTSSAIYDTAWLSMIQKPSNSGHFLFPQCFTYILRHQLRSTGGWVSYATPIDGILNTAAALLALKRHSLFPSHQPPTQLDELDWPLPSRISHASTALQSMLSDWDVASTDQVGFELLVTRLLLLLEESGVTGLSSFPGSATLRALHDAKLAKLPANYVYKARSTLHHSLEALTGYIDFSKVGHLKEENGSMLASPASTAAYLLGLAEKGLWDDESEGYLRGVVERERFEGECGDGDGGQKGDGGVPCAWPTETFEVTWVVTTLAEAGVKFGESWSSEGRAIRGYLERGWERDGGLFSFFPGGLVDADDTARAIMALRHLGNTKVGVEPLIRAFEAKDHFRTYEGERNPSISANCNVLTCLLMMDDPTIYSRQIVKTAKFLCQQVHTNSVREKWHINQLYWMMLLSQSFAALFDSMAANPSLEASVFQLAPELLQEQIPMTSLHVLTKVLGSQGLDGSWANGIAEVTAYGNLTLSWLSHLPWIQQLGRMHGVNFIAASIESGKAFLEAHRQDWKKGQYLWIEKVTYASPVLCEAYCLAAAVVPVPDFHFRASYSSVVDANGRHHVQLVQKSTTNVDSLFVSEGLLKGVLKAGQLISLTPLFRNLAPRLLRVAEMQACYALDFLQRKRKELGIFPETDVHATQGADEKEYMAFIPLTWTASNALGVQREATGGHGHGGLQSNYVLQEMMVLSMLNYQVDEYMETAVERDFLGFYNGSKGSLEAVRQVIDEVFDEFDPLGMGGRKRRSSIWGDADLHTPTNLKIIRSTLSRYVGHILLHPAVRGAPERVQKRLASEVKTFLLAHVRHAEDNIQFAAATSTPCTGQLNHDRQEEETGLPSPISESEPSSNPSSPEPPSKRRRLSSSASASASLQAQQPSKKIKIFTPTDSRTFYSWVRTTSADHTSCPFSFTFYTCLLSHNNGNGNNNTDNLFNKDAKTSYVAEAMVRSLASLCRMYNDYGSITRDAGEGNLNSVNFAEFHIAGGGTCSSQGLLGEEESRVKEELMWIAEYERRGLERSMGELEGLVGTEEMEKVRLFLDVTDLYGQIYVVRDIGVGAGVGAGARAGVRRG